MALLFWLMRVKAPNPTTLCLTLEGMRLHRGRRRMLTIEVLHKILIKRSIISSIYFKQSCPTEPVEQSDAAHVLILTVDRSLVSLGLRWSLTHWLFLPSEGGWEADCFALLDSTAKFLHLHLRFRNRPRGEKRKEIAKLR